VDNNKWVLITGGTRGIGRGLVEEFAAHGYDVVFTYQSSEAAAEQLAASASSANAHVRGYRCDSTDEAAVTEFSHAMLAAHGAPYAIVNNAGITRDVALMRMESEQWKSVIDTNLNSAFYIVRHFVAAMVERGDGVILQMSSISGIKGNPGQTNYCATKAGLIGMTRALALELARFNIRVNAIAPGFIATEMVEQIPEAQQRDIRKGIPLRRLGTVKEVATLCAFLASDNGSYMTGQTFVIDGGMSA
jgi:3-oxoacyl-[acyl-carrier protein] reductase